MSDSVFVPAWRKNDPKLEADAIAFWEAQNLLPQGLDPQKRARELCGLVYRGDEVIAVSTAVVQELTHLRCRLALYRCAAARSMRREPFSLQVTEESFAHLQKWSLENPNEKVMGMGAIIESRLLARHMPSVFWPVGLIFMGYMPNGQQLRVAWFKHATVNEAAPKRRHGFGQVPA
ncbi:MAG: hypothetical protein RJB62_712 [Pseudomonadota bacterium]